MNVEREIEEARQAGIKAIRSLERALDDLDSASNWGIFDMFTSGGIFASMAKHSKINDAKYNINQAIIDMKKFEEEIQDIKSNFNLNIEIDGFLEFADYFFDNILVDWMVQSRIKNAKREIDLAIDKIDSLLQEIDSWY